MPATTMRPPTTHDGRNLDRAIADERGEGATIEVDVPDIAWPTPRDVVGMPESIAADTYYDLPVVKAPPWRWYIASYFHVGGLAGAAATLASAAQLAKVDRRLVRRLHWIATLGEVTGGALLIADLGRPTRFLNMMRVFRPSSPMNVGTWILSAAGTSGGLALLGSLRGRDRARVSVTSAVSGIAGSLLATYTGVLLGNTAVPIWEATRRDLPLWFAAMSAASLGSLLELTRTRGRGLRAYAVVANAANLAGMLGVERAADRVGVGAPLRTGRAGRMWRAARWLGLASLAATVVSPRTRVLGGALGTAAGLLARFAIVEAGRASADDPHATFRTQRARM